MRLCKQHCEDKGKAIYKDKRCEDICINCHLDGASKLVLSLFNFHGMWKRLTACFSCGGETKESSGGAPEQLSANDGKSEKNLATELNDEGEVNENIEATSNAQHSSEFPQDGKDISTQDKSEERERLRCRVSERKSDEEGERKVKGCDDNSDRSCVNENRSAENELDSENSNVKSRHNVAQSPEIVSESTVELGKEKEAVGINKSEAINKRNDDGASDSSQTNSSKKHNTFNSIGDYQKEEITKVAEIALSEAVDEYKEKEGILGGNSSINNACNINDGALLSKELSIAGAENIEGQEIVKDEVSSLLESQPSIELKEDFVLPTGQAVKDDPLIVSTTNKSSDETSIDFNILEDINSEPSSKTKNSCPVNELVSKQEELEENVHVGTSSCASSDSYANEKGIDSAIAKKFSGKLSESVLDAVRQDTQLLNGRSEHEDLDNSSEKALLKFSSILADSIVKTVLDFSKISRAHVDESDKNSDLIRNGLYPHDSIDDSAEDVVPCESNAIEETFARDTIEKASHESLNEYAKTLSEQILNSAYELNGYCSEPVQCSLTEIYVAKLTKTILSDAIDGAKCCMLKRDPLPESNLAIEENLLDMFIDKIVEDILKDAISKVVVRDEVEQTKDEGGREGIQNHVDEENCSSQDVGKSSEIKNNGKLQSKWLSEDDLDELYDDDLSDEGDQNPENTPNGLGSSDAQTKKTQAVFWRKSLIQDLDEEMGFEEFENQLSSSPSSQAKPTNGELSDDASADEELETQESSRAAKATNSSQTTSSTPGRTRLRSIDSSPVLVFDNGSAYLKVGFSGEDTPREIVPSVVGTPLRYSQEISGMEYSYRPELVFGEEATGKAGVLHIDYPIKPDVIDKWSDIEAMWSYVLGSLMGVQENPEFPVLITEPALNPKKNTEKIAEIMFEHFHMPSLFIANQPALSLFSMGVTSGLSFCSGFNNTQAAVVYEGHILPHTVKQLDIAGCQLTETLRKLLMSRQGFGFRSSSQWQIVNGIKEKMAFVSLDFEKDAQSYRTQAELQQPYELPDGQVIEIGLERFGCAETLFRPMELGLTQSPAHTLITEAICSCDEELQDLCYKSIGISGGTTLMRGFVPRLEQELRECDRKFKNFTVPEHRELSTWIGGSVMASLHTFREMAVTVDEYADGGARVVHSKCF